MLPGFAEESSFAPRKNASRAARLFLIAFFRGAKDDFRTGDIMFAVMADSGRQYRIQPGDVLSVDYRAEAQDGDAVQFDQVLLANAGGASAIGRPVISGATVEGKVVV